MRALTPSDALIIGVSPFSLGFATILAKGGVNVLVIEESDKKTDEAERSLNLDAYCIEILQQHGYQLNGETTDIKFIEQSLGLLAQNLCSVIWATKLVSSANGKHHLTKDKKTQIHKSNFVFQLSDLEIDKSSAVASFTNVFVLAWRVIGVQFKNFHPFLLNSLDVETALISEFYQPKKNGGFLKKWIAKLSSTNATSLNLIGSSINLHLSQQRILEAGTLLPDLPFYDEKQKLQTSLYQWCNYQYFSLIVIGTVNPHYLFNVAKWVQLNFNIKLFYLPYSEKNHSIFSNLGITEKEKRTLMVRPDKYISFVNDILETDIIDNYLRNVLLMNANAEKKAIVA